jgi:hypothetical protein
MPMATPSARRSASAPSTASPVSTPPLGVAE